VPIVYAGKVFISSGYNRGCALVQVKDGKASAAWENKNMRNHCNCCVAVGDYVYGFDGQVGFPSGPGSLVCLKLADGSVVWSKKGLGTGTVVVADGKLIALGERGELVIAEAAPEYKELARFQAIGGHCWVMPVLANGKLYCRNNGGDVVCLDMSK
jgi:outer membrane protein assembly factor BamB